MNRRKEIRGLSELPRDPDREVERGFRRFLTGFRRSIALIRG
ncbi:MAG: hypothetical protein ABEK01_01125 [Candidatus Nanohaloarchaea archaeon]